MAGNGPLTGRDLGNRYRIGERIGLGGMAEVYSAQDSVLGRIVAVKVMLSQFASDPDFARRFRQEAAAAANLQSPYIVNVYDWGHDDDPITGEPTYYIVMEYIRGSDLKTAIVQRGAINQKKVAEIGAQVCQALTAAHQQDIIHRDIKPQNIMVQPDGNVKVMDFGIARAKNTTAEKTQTVLGTAHYASPEQAQGKELTYASDIYSLGVVLYEAATGVLPFDGPDAVSVALMQVQDTPARPSEVAPDIDPDLEAIIMTAMEKDPMRRFATANDMRLALNNYLAGRPIGTGGVNTGAFTEVLPLGVAAGVAGAEAADGFTGAQTRVLQPIGAAAGEAGSTQVMPVAPGSNVSHDGPKGYRSGSGSGMGGSGSRGAAGSHGGRSSGGMSGKKKAGIAIAVVVVLLAIAGAIFAFGAGGEQVPVPDVTGKSIEEAMNEIEQAGFKVGVTDSKTDESVEAGHVISQNPKGGSMAVKGSKIDLVISQGVDDKEIPDVTGKSEADAVKMLMEAQFIVGDVRTEASDSVEAGHVISQSPVGKSMAPLGTKVDLVISSGAEKVKVPDITGLSLDAARQKAEREGFSISQSGSEYSSSISKNCIISQSPSAGTEVAKGSTITYVISLGDDAVSVPGVIGYSESGARSALENAGLRVSTTHSYSSSAAAGTVISQSVGAGNRVSKGTTVTIEISDGPQPSAPSGNTEG